jgi:oxygen-dependent protoporphyrinogen oxidase
LGGIVRTEHVDGFVIDAGPDSLLVLKPGAVSLCRDLGLGEHLVPVSPPRTAYLYVDGQLLPYDADAVLGIPTSPEAVTTSRIFSSAGKHRLIRALSERADAPAAESIADFMRTRLGEEAVERVGEPLLASIHAGRADRLSVHALFPMLREAESSSGNLLQGLASHLRHAARADPFRSFARGMQVLVDAVVARLSPASVSIGTAVTAIDRRDGWTIRLEHGAPVEASRVIVATPTYRTAELVGSFDVSLGAMLKEIRYVSSAAIAFGYREAALPGPLSGTGFVVAPGAGVRITGATWVSAKWPGRAPAGHVLIRAYLAEERTPGMLDRGDDEIVRIVREDLARTMGITEEPVLARVYRWYRANPQYDVGHLERVRDIDALTGRHPGLYLTGSGLRGTGIPDCITDARGAAAGAARAARAHDV